MRKLIDFGLAVGFVFVCSISGFAQDEAAQADSHWPQWRGPNLDGTAVGANPPVEWSPDKNIRWRIEIPGRGSATPVIWDDKIFLLTAIPVEDTSADGDDGSAGAQESSSEARASQAQDDRSPQVRGQRGRGQQGRGQQGGRGRGRFGGERAPSTVHQFAVLCLDLQSGKMIWKTVVREAVPHESGHNTNTFASASPVTDGKHVFASFGSQGVFCLDMEGNVIWERDLGKMQTRNQFGEGSSPALYQNTLVVPFDHEGDSKLYALYAASGETRWEVGRDERTTWCTPYIVEANGRVQVITNGHRVRSYDLQDGELIWECGGQVENPIPSPVLLNDVVICMTGYRGNAVYAIPLNSQGDITDTDQVLWHRNDAAPYVPSPTLYKDTLYFTKSRDGIVSSLNAKTGEVIIRQTRLPGIDSVYASPIAAQDRVYFTGRDGTTVVIRHANELDVLATNSVGEPVDASPIMVGDSLIIRGDKHLFCIRNE